MVANDNFSEPTVQQNIMMIALAGQARRNCPEVLRLNSSYVTDGLIALRRLGYCLDRVDPLPEKATMIVKDFVEGGAMPATRAEPLRQYLQEIAALSTVVVWNSNHKTDPHALPPVLAGPRGERFLTPREAAAAPYTAAMEIRARQAASILGLSPRDPELQHQRCTEAVIELRNAACAAGIKA